MQNLLSKVLRMGEGKKLRVLEEKVATVNDFEGPISALSDGEIKKKTEEFRTRFNDGESLEHLLPEAFAVVREAAKRTVNMRHFDVQIMGGIVLSEGKIAEMKTGEGKTLVATLPVYLEALSGKSTHLITVNDYLAKRDSDWMGQVYDFLGLKVGTIQAMMPSAERRNAYESDVVYGTNSEFGFDYLRDNMATNSAEILQKDHKYAIVDEIDSILIDEARTPLIISGEPEKAADIYKNFAKIVPRLKDSDDFEVDEKAKTVAITESGITKVERALGIENLYDHVNSQLVNHLNQALRAHALFKRDVDYVLRDGEVMIVDEFTGRMMEGRRYSEGLHQAIEAKERVAIREENQTLATITLQNYFRMYEKLAGMTGTAVTEAEEFSKIYKLETVVIPTNRDMVRDDRPDMIYKNEDAKFKAVVEDIIEKNKSGQPILLGTISIEKSEKLSKMLKKKGIAHEVLNAKNHEREADIIAQAGRTGAVTVATNMAGRGVDIVLGGSPQDKDSAKQVLKAGGLYVLGTERHESRRIDNQLRGRSGRQGDPGLSRFYLSLDDDLMRLFGSERVKSIMERLGLPDDHPIEHPLISRSIETAQRQVESQNFEVRKRVLEYDDVMNQQRQIIYDQRRQIFGGENFNEISLEIIGSAVEGSIETFTNANDFSEEWDWEGLIAYLNQLFPLDLKKEDFDHEKTNVDILKEEIIEKVSKLFNERNAEFGEEAFQEIQRLVMLQVVDMKWREHLYEMDYLKEGIGLRAIGQRNPLIEYKSEGYGMFQEMTVSIHEDYLRYIFHVKAVEEQQPEAPKKIENKAAASGNETPHQRVSEGEKIGRNDLCPCGSGKKYKKCHGQ